MALGWHHVVVTFTAGGNATIYLDAVASTSLPSYPTPSSALLPTAFYVGGTNAAAQVNTLMDEFFILDRVMSADEVRAIYESEAPVFAETSTWQWRSANNLVWADSEGLWMRDVDGVAVLGVCGVDGKSWGGLTMNKGDYLLGYYGAGDGGWFSFDRDGLSSNGLVAIGYADQTIMRFDQGGASLYGVLDIDANGGIYQGTGTFSSPTTGLKIWNDAGIGRIAGYNAGAIQAYFGSDGILYGGSAQLDANGVSVAVELTSDSTRAYRFIDDVTGALVGYIGAYNSSNHGIDIEVPIIASTNSVFLVDSLAPSGKTSMIRLRTLVDGTVETSIEMINGTISLSGELLATDGVGTNGTNVWEQLGSYSAAGDAASNGYVSVTIDGTVYKLMTRA